MKIDRVNNRMRRRKEKRQLSSLRDAILVTQRQLPGHIVAGTTGQEENQD